MKGKITIVKKKVVKFMKITNLLKIIKTQKIIFGKITICGKTTTFKTKFLMTWEYHEFIFENS